MIQHPNRLLHNDGADAVTIDDTDGDGFFLGKVHLFSIHIFQPLQLFFQKRLKLLAGIFDLDHNPPSLV